MSAGVERALEVELLEVGGVEVRVDAFGARLLARDLDHRRRDVVAVRVEPVPRDEARHPAGAAAELDEAHARAQVEQLDHVARVDQVPRRLAGLVGERLRAKPLAPRLADPLGVLGLGLLACVHVTIMGVAGSDRNRTRPSTTSCAVLSAAAAAARSSLRFKRRRFGRVLVAAREALGLGLAHQRVAAIMGQLFE